MTANYSENVYVPKLFHRNIIGKDGATIRDIREATNCKILLPEPDDTSESITVTGVQKDVTKAVHMIQDIYRVQVRDVCRVLGILAAQFL